MKELLKRYPALEACSQSIEKALQIMQETYSCGGKFLVCGNGGSASDCEHIVGELMKGFMSKREIGTTDREKISSAYPEESDYFCKALQRGIPAISLPSQIALISAYINDVSADMVYAQLVYGYGKPCDTVIGLSTSGNSANVVNAVKIAKAMGLKTIALTGERSSILESECDVTIKAPETETYKIQEYHLPIYHYLCAELEKFLMGNEV